MANKGLTQPQERALIIVKNFRSGIAPIQFSQLMWPDSPGHQRHYQCGQSGSAIGIGMALAGGGYLGKLQKRGWVKRFQNFYNAPYYRITASGLAQLFQSIELKISEAKNND